MFKFNEDDMLDFLMYSRKDRKSRKISLWIDFANSEINFMYTYGHFDFFKDKEEFNWIKDILDDMEVHISDEYSNYSDSIPEGEHPEWHIYEIWESDHRSETSRTIIEKLETKYSFYRGVKTLDSTLIVSKRIKDKEFNQLKKFFVEYDIEVKRDTYL